MVQTGAKKNHVEGKFLGEPGGLLGEGRLIGSQGWDKYCWVSGGCWMDGEFWEALESRMWDVLVLWAKHIVNFCRKITR